MLCYVIEYKLKQVAAVSLWVPGGRRRDAGDVAVDIKAQHGVAPAAHHLLCGGQAGQGSPEA